MKLAVVLVAVLGFLCIAKVDAVNTLTAIDELISDAIRMGAPFLKHASGRLHGEIFGSGRAARSTDVILFNKSSKNFKLKYNGCNWGGWSSDMLPEYVLPSHTSIVFGMESNGFMTGVSCYVWYVANDGTYFLLVVDNPYFGRNEIVSTHSNTLTLLSTTGQGNNNQVRWIIEDKNPN